MIRKVPLTEAAKEHVFGIRDAYLGLQEKYRGGDFEVNDCQIDERQGCAIFSFVNGVPLASLLDECLDKDDMGKFNALINEYIKRINYKQDYPVSDFDLIFSNIMVNGPIWTIIDYEWTYGKCIPAKEQLWRAMFCYRLEDRKREKFDPKPLFDRMGITEKDAEVLLEEENAFQKYVTGNRKSMVEIWQAIGRKVILPRELVAVDDKVRPDDCIQIYLDEGNGFSEEDSLFPEEQYDDKHTVSLDIRTDKECRMVRVDPAFAPCLVTILSATWNGEPFADNVSDVSIHPQNGHWISDDSILFYNNDPNIEFGLTSEKLSIQERNHLCVTYIMTLLPENAAQAVADSLEAEASEKETTQPKDNILKKTVKKIIQKREERYYKDDEE